MLTRETETYLDIYPFVDRVEDLPSVRVSVYKLSGEVSFNGDKYTKEDVKKLMEAFDFAFKAIPPRLQPAIPSTSAGEGE